jgi:hypothetical protein
MSDSLSGGAIFQESKDASKHTFINHVFSSTEEDKAEMMNVIQYALMAIIPVVVLNKMIQRFVPEADPDKSSIELLAEVMIQVVAIFGGLILIHRMITFLPTYSGFKYENFTLTSVVLAFLVIVLSIQSKVGLKTNILVDRIYELWNGSSGDEEKANTKGGVRVRQPTSRHSPSQADYLDNNAIQSDLFPPAPTTTQSHHQLGSKMMPHQQHDDFPSGPVAANGLLGGAFGSLF